MIQNLYRLRYVVGITGEFPGFLTPVYEHAGELYRSILDAENTIIMFVKMELPLDELKIVIPIPAPGFLKRVHQQALYAYAASNVNYVCGEYREVKAYIEEKHLLKPFVKDEKAMFQLKELYYFVGRIKEWGEVLDRIDLYKFRKHARWIRYERQNVFEAMHKDICGLDDEGDLRETPGEITVFGGNPLVGEVEIGGSNETALAILAASMLSVENILLTNIPDTNEVAAVLGIINGLGGEASFSGENTVSVNCRKLTCNNLGCIRVENSKIRRYIFSALYARFGDRQFIDDRLNPEIRNALARAIKTDGKKKHNQVQKIFLNEPSIPLTVQLLLVAAATPLQTELVNASREPCVVALADFLNTSGICAKGAGTDRITVSGGNRFREVAYENIPDYMEASVFIFASMVTKGYVKIKNVIPCHLRAVLNKCEEMGAEITILDNAVIVEMNGCPRAVRINFCSYPGLSDHYSSLFLVALGLARGTGVINNARSQDCFSVLKYLKYIGVGIGLNADSVGCDTVIEGTNQYSLSDDILYSEGTISCIALLLVMLSVNGKNCLCNCKDLDAAFSRIIYKLSSIGALTIDGSNDVKDLLDHADEEAKRKYS